MYVCVRECVGVRVCMYVHPGYYEGGPGPKPPDDAFYDLFFILLILNFDYNDVETVYR